MEKVTKNYVESLNYDPNWLKTITIEIDKFLINREYIDFFIQMYTKWRKYEGSTSSFQKLIIPHLPHFGKLDLSKFKLYIETETMNQFFVSVIAKTILSFGMLKVKERFFVFYTC